ncbi:zinc finger HIT domain-containing protein 2 [Lycorma delicatula]|uniref:zinc finger HIT domain-containing protein 2 n=1 Tax=Lycorma delicatula TaxID=130591 RepID=UPI003F517E63
MDCNKLCGVCKKIEGKYVCPRCNILYCSVNCYQEEIHARCSEAFYKDCTIDEIKSIGPNVDSQKKMLEILKRLHENVIDDGDEDGDLDSDDDVVDDNDNDLVDRLKDIDLNDTDKVWNKLTDREKKEFEELLKSGDVSDILPKFEPWWNYRDDRKIIDLEEISYFENVHKKKCPNINEKSVTPLYKISKISPAPTVCYNLMNVLAAYSFIVRYFNGDHFEFINEATILLISISNNLSSNQNFDDFESAVQNVFLEISNCQQLSAMLCDRNEIKKDVVKIINGPDINNNAFYVLAALSDIHLLFVNFLLEKKLSTNKNIYSEFSKRFPESGASSLQTFNKTKIKSCLKKTEYYQSWTVEYSPLLL